VYELEFLYLDFQGNRKANFYYENGLLLTVFGCSVEFKQILINLLNFAIKKGSLEKKRPFGFLHCRI
jgi:hypothetical protein